MTYLEAIATRVRHLNGRPVTPSELDEAIRVIQTTKPPPKRQRKSKVQVDMGSPAPLQIPRFIQQGAPRP